MKNKNLYQTKINQFTELAYHLNYYHNLRTAIRLHKSIHKSNYHKQFINDSTKLYASAFEILPAQTLISDLTEEIQNVVTKMIDVIENMKIFKNETYPFNFIESNFKSYFDINKEYFKKLNIELENNHIENNIKSIFEYLLETHSNNDILIGIIDNFYLTNLHDELFVKTIHSTDNKLYNNLHGDYLLNPIMYNFFTYYIAHDIYILKTIHNELLELCLNGQ